MKIHESKSQFGWEGDNGIGERLIQEILDGVKTATAGPKSLYSLDELAETFGSKGPIATVTDKHGVPRCNIFIDDVFETTFGAPDARLIGGEGFGTDVLAFQEAHRTACADLVESGKLDLNGETLLVVELFHLSYDKGE